MTPETLKYTAILFITLLALAITLHAFCDRRVKSGKESTQIGFILIITWTAVVYAWYTTAEVLRAGAVIQ